MMSLITDVSREVDVAWLLAWYCPWACWGSMAQGRVLVEETGYGSQVSRSHYHKVGDAGECTGVAREVWSGVG